MDDWLPAQADCKHRSKHSPAIPAIPGFKTKRCPAEEAPMAAVSHRICSSVTVKALHSGWPVLSQMAGFFSAATEVCPVIGAEVMCRALAMDDSNVSSLMSGPTPADGGGQVRPGAGGSWRFLRPQDKHSPCRPFGSSMVRRTCSVTSSECSPLNLLSQNSCWQRSVYNTNISLCFCFRMQIKGFR